MEQAVGPLHSRGWIFPLKAEQVVRGPEERNLGLALSTVYFQILSGDRMQLCYVLLCVMFLLCDFSLSFEHGQA